MYYKATANHRTNKPKATRGGMNGYVRRFNDQVIVSLFIGVTAILLWLFLLYLPEIFTAIWQVLSFISNQINYYV